MSHVEGKVKRTFSIKVYWKEMAAVLILLLAVYFFRSQVGEIRTIVPRIKDAQPDWTFSGLLVMCFFVLLQAMTYVASFRSVNIRINLLDAIELYLKRNVLSVFLPAGALASLAYTPHRLKKKHVNSSQGVKASLLFGYIAILTVFIVGVPVIAVALIGDKRLVNAWIWLALLGALLGALILLVRSFVKKGWIYRLVLRISPSFAVQLEDLVAQKMNKRHMWLAIFYSCLIEVVSIAMVYVSIRALGLQVSMKVAAVGYIVSVIPMMLSPFLRGLGAVEFTLAYLLARFGFDSSAAMGVTFLYRIFQFWLPLLLGLAAFLWKGRELIGRVLPAAGMMLLGLATILAVLNLPLSERFQWGVLFLPIDSMHASRMLMVFVGIVMMIVSANLIRGHRNAFVLALVLAAVSLVWHLVRTINVMEALLSFSMLVLLLVYRREYRVKSDLKWLSLGFKAFYVAFLMVFLFDFLGFYLLDKQHFGVEFSLLESLEYTLRSFFLLDNNLIPESGFAREFLAIVHLLAFFVWMFLVITLFKTRKVRLENVRELRLEAECLVREFGDSSMDFFKLGKDKLFFIPTEFQAMIAYRVARGIAVVLEDPVCAKSDKIEAIRAFEAFSLNNGWKPCYFMVGEESLDVFKPFNKKKILLGQDALIDVNTFNERSVHETHSVEGFRIEICEPPHPKYLLEELHNLSNEWLGGSKRRETGFSTSQFDLETLKKEVLIVLHDEKRGKPVAFLSVVTAYTTAECKLGIYRHTASVTEVCHDDLVRALVDYAADKGYHRINLGIASSIGIIEPETMPERIQHYIFEKFKSLRDFQHEREFKGKYATHWRNRYLLYDGDYDLLKIPMALKKVMRPPFMGLVINNRKGSL